MSPHEVLLEEMWDCRAKVGENTGRMTVRNKEKLTQVKLYT